MTAGNRGGTREGPYGSDFIVGVLADLGIEALALNPGATIRGLHDSVSHGGPGSPRLVTCLHEEIAVALAHGYARATGKPMAVGLHDTVGILHAAMAIFNAWVDRTPMIILVGTGPLDSERRRPWLDWVHTVGEQGGLVRDFSVWNDQPTSLPALRRSLQRAWRAAVGTPGGPAIVGVDVELQEAGGVDLEVTTDNDLKVVARIAPDPALVTEVTRRLHSVQRPLLVTDRQLGEGAADALVDLAEMTGAGVYDMGMGNVPVGHPHDLTESSSAALDACDLLVFVDARDPGWALGTVDLTTRRMSGEGGTAGAVNIGLDDLRPASWMVAQGDQPRWLSLTADPELALLAILESWDEPARPMDASLQALAVAPPAEGRAGSEDGIGRDALASHAAAAVADRDYVISNGVLRGWTRRAFRPSSPSRFLGIQEGAGQGYGLPASVGAALGLQGSGRVVVDLQADGDLLYVPQALWTLAHLRVPLLVIVDANRKYGQDALHQKAMEQLRGRDPVRPIAGVDLVDPLIGIADLARAFGVAAEGPITSLEELGPALATAVERVASGEPSLVEVVTIDD